jgi:hypothetical protein
LSVSSNVLSSLRMSISVSVCMASGLSAKQL